MRVCTDGVDGVFDLPDATKVMLEGTCITGIGKELADFKQLQALNLSGTSVTDAGLRDLREVLPFLQIVH